MEEIRTGIELVAVDHSPVAVETNQINHRTDRHYVQDMDLADPKVLVPEDRLDLLMASPECRYYPRARDGKPINAQGRMNPWIIHRWVISLDGRCRPSATRSTGGCSTRRIMGRQPPAYASSPRPAQLWTANPLAGGHSLEGG